MVLAQPAQSLTDLLLGLVVLVLAVQLRRTPTVPRYWLPPFWWSGVAAVAGAFHHAVMVRWARPAEISWAVISVLVVVAVSYLLAATVREVLGPGRARVFWLLRSVGLAAYLGAAVSGHAGVTAMLTCESLTMLSVLGLWFHAARQHHPLARPVLAAVLASGAAAITKVVPAGITGRVGLDPTSAYHLAQIVGMALLYRAVSRRADTEPAEARPGQALRPPRP
ncbi:hypothetical protein [Actinoplanes sp. NPDC051411]|uniref:DUF6962 family protein n=1 Tax=Actinoplanes sp. NPDC051411 TaxID=3155522 RepID=UPI00343BDBA0